MSNQGELGKPELAKTELGWGPGEEQGAPGTAPLQFDGESEGTSARPEFAPSYFAYGGSVSGVAARTPPKPGLRITEPVEFSPATLVSTNVDEDDYNEWSSGATYQLQDRVIKGHKIWESAQNENEDHDPEEDHGQWWLEVGPTNRWAAFERNQVTATKRANKITYTFAPGRAITAIHVVGLKDAATIEITLTDPTDGVVWTNGTQAIGRIIRFPSWWEWCFGTRRIVNDVHYYDVPSYPEAEFYIEINGGADLAVQLIYAGPEYRWGVGVLYGATVRFDSWSRVERNQWGDAKLRKGNSSRTLKFRVIVERDSIDEFYEFVAGHDTDVLMWTLTEQYRVTRLLGFFTKLDMLLNYPDVAEFSMEVEGMAIA